MADVAQAAEITVTEGTTAESTYASQVRDMVATTKSQDLSPRKWLDKLSVSATNDSAAVQLTPGTYVVAFNTQSTKGGLRILMGHKGPSWLPPHVKISNGPLSSTDWSELCDLEQAIQKGLGSSKVCHALSSNYGASLRIHISTLICTPNAIAQIPANWSKGKNWMGPDVTSEKHLTTTQKYFYGVLPHSSPCYETLARTRRDVIHRCATAHVHIHR